MQFPNMHRCRQRCAGHLHRRSASVPMLQHNKRNDQTREDLQELCCHVAAGNAALGSSTSVSASFPMLQEQHETIIQEISNTSCRPLAAPPPSLLVAQIGQEAPEATQFKAIQGSQVQRTHLMCNLSCCRRKT